MVHIAEKTQQKWVMVGLGEGGGKVAADFILYSRYLRDIVSSVYFLNTAGEDLVSLKQTRLKEAYKKEWVRSIGEGLSKERGIPIDFIKFAFFGTGNDFIKSKKLFIKYVLGSQEFSVGEERFSTEAYALEEIEPQKGTGEYDLKVLKSYEPEESSVTAEDLSKSPIEGGLQNLFTDLIDAQNVILVHSLGGGTGGGSAPVLARWVKKNVGYEFREPTVVSVCFLASRMDGPLRMANSLHNLMRISQEADIVLLFSNEILLSTIPREEGEEERFLQMNKRIVKAVDILLSPTAISERGGCVSVNIDVHNLKTYLRLIFSDGESQFPVNIAVPFVSIEKEENLSAPMALYYALSAEQVSIYPNTLVGFVPFFLSPSEKVCSEEFHHKRLEMYRNQIKVKHLQEMYELEIESVTGVADPDYHRSSGNIDVLGLGLAKLDLKDYKDALKNPKALMRWNRFLTDERGTSEGLALRVGEWIDTYNQKIDELNDMMIEYNKRRGEE